MTDDTPELGGGQIWKQTRFPYYTCYIAFLSGDQGVSQMAQMSDPREQGSVAWSRGKDASDLWDPDELYAHLLELDYECQGQLSKLIGAELDDVYELGKAGGPPPPIPRRWDFGDRLRAMLRWTGDADSSPEKAPLDTEEMPIVSKAFIEARKRVYPRCVDPPPETYPKGEPLDTVNIGPVTWVRVDDSRLDRFMAWLGFRRRRTP